MIRMKIIEAIYCSDDFIVYYYSLSIFVTMFIADILSIDMKDTLKQE